MIIGRTGQDMNELLDINFQGPLLYLFYPFINMMLLIFTSVS